MSDAANTGHENELEKKAEVKVDMDPVEKKVVGGGV
jgi:hypothetical protein